MTNLKKESHKSLYEISSFLNLTNLENSQTTVRGISSSSATVKAGDLFVAIAGEKSHGAKFIEEAINSGAVAALTDTEGAKLINNLIPTLVINDPRRILGELSAWFYGYPGNSLELYGVTGTNGKTTVSYLLNQIWNLEGRNTGIIGTLGVEISKARSTSNFTTPEADQLQEIFANAREKSVRNLVMEVSSIAIEMHRVKGLKFRCVAFTNMTQDHLDFHGTMDNYKKAKFKLFTLEYSDCAIINIDDPAGLELFNLGGIPMESVSRRNRKANWFYEHIAEDGLNTAISLRGSNGILIETKTSLIGSHNLDNLLLAIAMAIQSGVDPLTIAQIVPLLQGAPGRLEQVVNTKNIRAIVDYAHTPDAVIRVLESVKSAERRIIGVLGCGGDRDKSKRPLMGRALVAGTDIAIFTSDNPRNEDPELILDEMIGEIEINERNLRIADRREAIATAVTLIEPGDCLIVLGKGHELGQQVGTTYLPFDDREEVLIAIEKLS